MSDHVNQATDRISTLAVRGKAIKGRVWEVSVIQAGWATPPGGPEFYSPDVLKEACALYEGVPVHSYSFGESMVHLPREVQEVHPSGLLWNQIGILRNVKMGEVDGIPAMVGEIHLDSDEIAAAFTSRMNSASPLELSVDQRIRYIPEPKGARVVKIVAAHSLDTVNIGAAGGRPLRAVAAHFNNAGATRQGRAAMAEPIEIRTVEGLRAAHPELLASALKPVETELSQARTTLSARDAEIATLKESNASLAKERDELKGKVEAAEKRATESAAAEKRAKHEAAVEKRITASKLPADKVTDLFRKQLLAAADEATVDALIADREALVPAESRATESVDVTARRATTPAAAEQLKTKVNIIENVFGKPEAAA